MWPVAMLARWIIARPNGRGHDLLYCYRIGFLRKVDSTFRSDAEQMGAESGADTRKAAG